MDVDVQNRRHLALLVAGAVVVTVVASIGFASLTDNPLTPDASFEATDATDDYELNQTGTVGMVAIEHTGGEPVDVSELEIILGSRTSGARFNASANWQFEAGDIVYAVLLNGSTVDAGDAIESGERLVVAKTRGTAAVGGDFDLRVRLSHLPSRNTLVDTQVGVS